tara:strand:+ start:1084 stop:1287 length:204 start_codon:yes stop_codon:yes gene_type:complete
MEILDRMNQPLKVGDDVAFAAGGWVEKGYVYKIDSRQIYVTIEPKTSRPVPTGFMGHEKARDRILKL